MNNSQKKSLSSACILVIGNEILSGRTEDKNINFIAKRCDEIGVSIDEVRIIPDEIKIIKDTVLFCHKNFDYVFTTGGIGPTHDDITTECIGSAFNLEVEVNKEALKRLKAHYNKLKVELNESRIKMAKIPKGAELIDNPVSSAPGFIVENIFVLPGVPKILQAMFNGIEDKIRGVTNIVSKNIVVYSAEGEIAELLESIQGKYPDVSIGSYPYFRPPDVGTNIVLRSIHQNLISEATIAICKKLKEYKIQFEKT
ncbi:MAG: CinA-like protein [Alphaproteobacteria bacterium MarineAlpha9_Bin3]|nr:MAG: CinA-like protein [Alphaproteobacteria bacterium MarineAlpha9_Bin3]|tara:strand:+ start:2587 stop:3351 length:765 start_codon:yes stop_codon:yes gene_type:complete